MKTSIMSQQKILLNYAEFKKLKEVEHRYHELQNQIAGKNSSPLRHFMLFDASW